MLSHKGMNMDFYTMKGFKWIGKIVFSKNMDNYVR